MLDSGLSDWVADEESLARFLTQSDQFGKSKQTPPSIVAKAPAFMPFPKYKNTSVFRKDRECSELKEIWNSVNTAGRSLKAIAFLRAGHVRQARLEVEPKEPPPAHANIEAWPWFDNDPRMQKSEQLALASQLAAAAEVILA
jgi:hypothetical protein